MKLRKLKKASAASLSGSRPCFQSLSSWHLSPIRLISSMQSGGGGGGARVARSSASAAIRITSTLRKRVVRNRSHHFEQQQQQQQQRLSKPKKYHKQHTHARTHARTQRYARTKQKTTLSYPTQFVYALIRDFLIFLLCCFTWLIATTTLVMSALHAAMMSIARVFALLFHPTIFFFIPHPNNHS